MRGRIHKRGSTYLVTVSAGVDPVTGKRLRLYRTAQTRKEAEVELTRLLAQVDAGTVADPGRLQVAEYLRDRWLPHIATRVRPRTALRYRQIVERHVLPKIGAVKLAKLRPAHVQAVVDAALARGLAPRTAASVYRVLGGALKQAVRWQIMSTNPAAAVRPPRAERPDLQVPDPPAVARVLEAAHGTRLYVPLVLASTTGMRRGEVLGLRWQEVELDAALVRVVRSLHAVGGELMFAEPKTARARRTVALPPITVALLRQHRKEQAERRLLLGEAWTTTDLVVDRGDGQPYSPDALSRAFYRLVRSLGLPGLRLHDLRHAYASTLLRANVHPKIVSEALGHSAVSFTLDVYSHLLPGMGERAAEAIEAALGTAIQGRPE